MAIDPNLITTIRAGELSPAPLSLTSILVHEVDGELKQVTLSDLVNFIIPLVGAFQYEVRCLRVSNLFRDENFDESGIGINLCIGWKIANLNGRTMIAYGIDYPFLGVVGGEKQHTLTVSEVPSLNANYTGSNADNGDPGDLIVTASTQSNGVRTFGTNGGGQPHNNMQPYEVVLMIEKL